MEMKADIAGKPKDTMFHKIYIQRHENVRWALPKKSWRYTRDAPIPVPTLSILRNWSKNGKPNEKFRAQIALSILTIIFKEANNSIE